MIVLACQTDFVARNELFLNLAKDICMHIVSTPIAPQYVSESEIPGTVKSILESDYRKGLENKPPQVLEKIVEGKLKKYYSDFCLLNQPFVKDDKMTVRQLIQTVSTTVGEKIELKQFVKMSTSGVPYCREDGCH
jgi:elongation factor Ts